MAARKRRALSRTMALFRIRKGRAYFSLAAWRTISKSRLTSGCVSKSCSCGKAVCLLLRLRLLELLLGRTPILILGFAGNFADYRDTPSRVKAFCGSARETTRCGAA